MTVFESREPDEWSVDVAYLSIGDIHDRYATGDLTPDQLIRLLHRRNESRRVFRRAFSTSQRNDLGGPQYLSH